MRFCLSLSSLAGPAAIAKTYPKGGAYAEDDEAFFLKPSPTPLKCLLQACIAAYFLKVY